MLKDIKEHLDEKLYSHHNKQSPYKNDVNNELTAQRADIDVRENELFVDRGLTLLTSDKNSCCQDPCFQVKSWMCFC